MTRLRRLSALTSADVDTLKSALRLAIRTERQTLHHDRARMPAGAVANVQARITAMETLADGLSPSAPPALPMGEDFAVCAGASDCPDCAMLEPVTVCDDRR